MADEQRRNIQTCVHNTATNLGEGKGE